jgi:hypothetical protein
LKEDYAVLRRLMTLLAVLATLPAAGSVHAQLPADANWRTIESRHFRVTYHSGLESLARHAAASAERAHAALSVLVAQAPRGMIDLVVSDNTDFTNGYATPFPSNRIVVYAKPPVDLLELQYMHDWIDLVVVHELAHIFHLDVTGRVGQALRAVFGRAPAPWPFFPAVLSPAWSIEGLAVGVESAMTGFGRVHGSYHEMVVRTATLQDRIDDIDRLDSVSPVWPGPARIYIYGSLFMDYLARRFGPEATARIVRSTAGALLPPPVAFDQVARHALGVTFRQAYDEWRVELDARYAALAAELSAHGLTVAESLTDHGGFAMHPRFSSDGRSIAYSMSDGRSRPATRVMDATTGDQLWSRRSNGVAGVDWVADGRVLTSDLDFVDQFRVFSDLHIVEARGARRLTHGARLQDPTVAPDGATAVAVENALGTNRLVRVDLQTGERRALTDFEPDVHWALPRFSPDGASIAAGIWREGGRYDVVVLDTLGRVLVEVTDGPGVSAAPAWSPDGRWLLFWSDRTGIPNLYAADMRDTMTNGQQPGLPRAPDPAGRPVLRQVTNVLTGAYHPDVSPDGRWIVFAAYHHDGFRIERLPFDTRSWRDLMPVADPDHHATAHPRAPVFAESVAAAAANADTAAGAAGPYRAARHTRPYGWLPVAETQPGRGATPWYFGASLYGRDLVERHNWAVSLLTDPQAGRIRGNLAYTYRGLASIPGLGLHPSLGLRLQREWDEIGRDTATDRFIDEREDVGAASLVLNHQRMRRVASIGISGEMARRSRYLFGTGWPDAARLRDPVDDLFGVRVATAFANATLSRFAISREDGVALQFALRQRWDRNPHEAVVDDERLVFDRSYTEITTWDAAYLALPLPGFARHVVAARFSGLFRVGPGASPSSIGGASTQTVWLPGLAQDIGGTSRLLPVRGFDPGVRRGTRAWTASGEYRAPLALVSRALRPLPVFFDRLSAAGFVDAGHAWCRPTEDPATVPCPSVSAGDPPLVSAGAEITSILSLYGVALPVRVGVAFPLQGDPRNGTRIYVLGGAGF